MDEENLKPSDQDRIESAASDWVAKQDEGFTPEEQDAFFEWLAADPQHGEAYSARQLMWKELNLLAEWRPEHSVEPNPDLLAVRPGSKIIRWSLAITALAAVFLVGLLVKNPWTEDPSSETILLSSEGGALFYEYHVLEDDSVVELNRGAQVSVSYSEDLRLINLIAGEAHFTVAKDASRPFVVQARNTVVKAIGTAFNVSLGSEEIEVLVTEGRVIMTPAITPLEELTEDFETTDGRELIAGQASSLSLQSVTALPMIEEFTSEQIARRLSWKNEVLEFTAVPLSEVILEFNRRNHTQLVIENTALGQRQITATLRPNNLNGFIELLELTLNVRAQKTDEFKIILQNGTP